MGPFSPLQGHTAEGQCDSGESEASGQRSADHRVVISGLTKGSVLPLYPTDGLKHLWLSQPAEDLIFEELLAEISARLVVLPADQVDHGIEGALRLICNSLKIEHSTIFLREIDNPDVLVMRYVLRDPGLSPPPIKFTVADNFPWSNKKFLRNEINYLPDTQSAPEEAAVDKASWKKYNVISTLAIPLSTGGG